MAHHELKCHPGPFRAVRNRIKTFEIRKNDRNFQMGDTLILREYDPRKGVYTGEGVMRAITYILEGGQYGLQEGYIAMALV